MKNAIYFAVLLAAVFLTSCTKESYIDLVEPTTEALTDTVVGGPETWVLPTMD